MANSWTATRIRSLRAKLQRGDVVSLWQAGCLLQLVEGERAGYGKRSYEKIRAKVGGGVMERRLILARRLTRWDRRDAERAAAKRLSFRAIDALLTLDGACRGANKTQQVVKAKEKRRTFLHRFPSKRKPEALRTWFREVREARMGLISSGGKRRLARFHLKFVEGRLAGAAIRLKEVRVLVSDTAARRINQAITQIEVAMDGVESALTEILRNDP